MCHIKAIKRRRRECVRRTAGKKYSSSSLATRFKTAEIDSTMTLQRRMLFAARSERGMPFLFAKEMFINSNYFSFCFTVRSCAREARRGRAIKWFSRHSTSGWQSDKISLSSSSSSSSSLSRITISREMKKFFGVRDLGVVEWSVWV